MSIELTIVTPQGEAFRGSVESVVLPGSEGDFGVLRSHERFLTPLRIGDVEIRTERESLWASIAHGFADVSGEEVVVLVESCELANEIDVARADLARERAEQGLAQLGDPEEQRYREYDATLQRSRSRIRVGAKAGER